MVGIQSVAHKICSSTVPPPLLRIACVLPRLTRIFSFRSRCAVPAATPESGLLIVRFTAIHRQHRRGEDTGQHWTESSPLCSIEQFRVLAIIHPDTRSYTLMKLLILIADNRSHPLRYSEVSSYYSRLIGRSTEGIGPRRRTLSKHIQSGVLLFHRTLCKLRTPKRHIGNRPPRSKPHYASSMVYFRRTNSSGRTMNNSPGRSAMVSAVTSAECATREMPRWLPYTRPFFHV